MLSSLDYLILPVIACIAVGLDLLLGEPKRFHPLVGFGWLAQIVESKRNTEKRWAYPHQRFAGLLAMCLLIIPFGFLAWWLRQAPITHYLSDILFLYFALGHKSLHTHAYAVRDALNNADQQAAQTAAAYMVSRDPETIEPASATIESVLENGHDGVFGALFWFFIAGGMGALIFRLVNTLDAMWGYKNKRFLYFGWAAAKLDDIAGYCSARLTAITYALLGHSRTALRCWQQQAPLWKSPNAGPVMAAGAGALQIQVGGPASYHGKWQQRPNLGEGTPAVTQDINRALRLVRHGVWLWLGFALFIGCLLEFMHA